MTDAYHNLDAERAVLGMMLVASSRVLPDLQATDLQAGHFYRDTHRALWELLVARWEAGKPVDTVAVAMWLGERPEAEQVAVGGLPYLTALGDDIPSTENVCYYAARIVETATRRQVRADAQHLLERASQGAETPELLDLAHQQLTRLGAVGEDAWVSMAEAVDLHRDDLAVRQAARDAGASVGLRWGVPEIDEQMAPLEPGDLVIVGARPAMGKTSLAVELLRQAVRGLDASGAMFSLEMTLLKLTRKLISLESSVETARMRDGRLSGAWGRAVEAAHAAAAPWSLFMDDSPALRIEEIQGRLRRLAARLHRRKAPPLRLAVVDYAQLIRADGDNENLRLAEVTRKLKVLAKELQIVVVALAQVNRACEARQDKRPMMSDLRGSGQMEQDADVIAFLYRHHEYDRSWPADEAEIIFRKVREGEKGTVSLCWDGRTQRFGRPPVADNIIPAPVPVPAPINPYAEPRR